MPDLLVELFSEEIPARMQRKAADDLRRLMTDGLVEAGLTYAHAGAFATPRRLALTVEGLSAESPTTREERKGPRADAPEKAVEGFLRSTGLAREDLEVRQSPKGEVLFAVVERPGRPAPEIVAEVLRATVRGFPWPKSMRWGEGTLRWVRPLHRVLCILHDDSGSEVVPVEIGGVIADDVTEGHRFMAPEPFSVVSFEDYAAKLKRAKVILPSEERAEQIWHDASQLAFSQGLDLVEDRGLLAEVAGLVEWPVVLMGEIEARFLDLPPEVLKTSMREHQKFFSVTEPARGQAGPPRIVRFVTVANRETADHGATILAGNRKVLSARLSDAAFFWENDLAVARAGMAEWRDRLSHVTFHARLGSQADRIGRIASLSREIARMVDADPERAEQAASVAKLDLASEMVYEFPELQGVMGRSYAAAAGLPEDVAAAVEAHYAPLGPSDAVPHAPLSIAVALADKIDMLAGFWAIDEKPTGSKDPFALRRAALGVIRLALENDLRLPLLALIRHALSSEPIKASADRSDMVLSEHLRAAYLSFAEGEGSAPEVEPVASDLMAFFHDRLKVHLRDRGIRHDVIDAVIAMEGSDDLTLVVKRAEALADVLKTDDGENLVQGFRRANNILQQAEEADGVEYSFGPDRKFAETEEELRLFHALDAAEDRIAPAMASERFAEAMAAMAALRGPIDEFFEAVQVNTDVQVVRRNRLNLLNRIRATCLAAADLSRIEG